MSNNRRLPKQAPPIAPTIPQDVRRVLEYFKEQLDVGSGFDRGDKRHRWLRAIDLENAGLGRFNPNINGGDGGFEPPGSGGVGPGNRPTTPQNMAVSGGYDWIHVRWDPMHGWPTTEVWRAASSDNIANAVLVGTVGGYGHQYADMDVTYGVTYHYWLRFVREDGIPGPFAPPNGMSGAIVLQPDALLNQLQGRIQQTELHSTLNTYINGLANQYTLKIGQNGHVAGFGLAFTGPNYNPANPNHSMALFNVNTFAITSPNSGSLQFAVEDGQVVMDAAYISNLVVTDAVVQNVNVSKLVGNIGEFVTLNIQDASITSAKIANQLSSDNYAPGVSGWSIWRDGTAEFRNITARGNIQASSLQADTAMVGTLHVNGNAITSMQVRTGSSGSVSALGTSTAISAATFPMVAGSTGVAILCTAVVGGTSGSGSNCQLSVRRNGVTIGSVTTSAENGWTSSIATIVFDTTPGLNPSYSLHMSNVNNGMNSNGQEPFNYATPRMAILGAFR